MFVNGQWVKIPLKVKSQVLFRIIIIIIIIILLTEVERVVVLMTTALPDTDWMELVSV